MIKESDIRNHADREGFHSLTYSLVGGTHRVDMIDEACFSALNDDQGLTWRNEAKMASLEEIDPHWLVVYIPPFVRETHDAYFHAVMEYFDWHPSIKWWSGRKKVRIDLTQLTMPDAVFVGTFFRFAWDTTGTNYISEGITHKSQLLDAFIKDIDMERDLHMPVTKRVDRLEFNLNEGFACEIPTHCHGYRDKFKIYG